MDSTAIQTCKNGLQLSHLLWMPFASTARPCTPVRAERELELGVINFDEMVASREKQVSNSRSQRLVNYCLLTAFP
jgi:hypothetical protein